MDLTPPQQRAIAWEDGPLLLRRSARIGQDRGARAARSPGSPRRASGPERVLVLTSTRATAQRLRRRVESLLDGPYEELWIGTWEAIAERLLREHSEAAGLDPFFDVVGRAERLAMLLDRFDELPMRSQADPRQPGRPARPPAGADRRAEGRAPTRPSPNWPSSAPPTTGSSPRPARSTAATSS